MKRIVTSLPFRLLLGVVIGIIAGQLSGTALMNIVVTVKFVLGALTLILTGYADRHKIEKQDLKSVL